MVRTSLQYTAMKGIFAILILLFMVTAAAARRSEGETMRRILERNKLPIANQEDLALRRKYDYLRGISGEEGKVAEFYPFSFHTKTKSGFQERRGLTTPIWFSKRLPAKEAGGSFLDRIIQKIVVQGVLQALALDLGYTHGSNN